MINASILAAFDIDLVEAVATVVDEIAERDDRARRPRGQRRPAGYQRLGKQQLAIGSTR